jgi:hypothetical protein
MLKYFRNLSEADKSHFFNVSQTCKKDPTKSLLYFYTFMFHFWVTTLQYRKGNSPNLVTNILPHLTKEQAVSGRYPNAEREKMFDKMGITYTIMDVYTGDTIKKDTDTLIVRNSNPSKPFEIPSQPLVKKVKNYTLDSCLLRLVGIGYSHAISGVINPDNGKFYIVDSNGITYDIDWSGGGSKLKKKILNIPRYKKYHRIVFESYMYVNITNLPAFDTNLFKRVSYTLNKSPLKSKPKSPLLGTNSKGRQIHRGPKGGLYVLEGGRKIYKFTR